LGSGIQVFLSRKLVLHPASEVEGLLKTQVCVCVCVSLSLSLSLSLCACVMTVDTLLC
jgi:hypothetical protein